MLLIVEQRVLPECERKCYFLWVSFMLHSVLWRGVFQLLIRPYAWKKKIQWINRIIDIWYQTIKYPQTIKYQTIILSPNFKHIFTIKMWAYFRLPSLSLSFLCLTLPWWKLFITCLTVLLNWILKYLLESCFIMNSITNFLCRNIDSLNSVTAVENSLPFFPKYVFKVRGIIFI